MAQVELVHVEKVFGGGSPAVADLTLTARDGELLVVVGPSGCGKSTVLRLVAGLEEPTRGTVRIGGEVVNERTPQERNVAMVFQDYALYPYLTVRGNLEFPLRMRRLPRAEVASRVRRVAEMLGMEGWLERRPGALSGGQRQRVAMGRALVREPSVFLLDEPLSNLDARLRLSVRDEIAELQRRTGTTMLYVTHDQTEAMTLGHRVAVLHEGRLQQVGPPRELYDRPANAFVAGFVGSPPMNLLPARLVGDGRGGPCLVLAGLELPLALAGGASAPRGTEVATAGLRPEALRLAADGEAALAAVVQHVEYLGHESLIHARIAGPDGEIPCVARLPGNVDAVPGDRLHLAVDPTRVHLFDAGGRAVAVGAGQGPGEPVAAASP